MLLSLASSAAFGALRSWEPSDYVQESLVLHYDGIRNDGLNADHNNEATTWKDLSPSAKDATFNTAEDGSKWTEDGYLFGGGSYATASGTVSLGTVATVQAVTKTTIATLRESMGVNGNQWSMFIGGKSSVNDACNIYYNKGNKKFVFKNANGGNADLLQDNWDGRYLTAIRNGNEKYLFSGAALPSSPAASGFQSAMGDVQFWLGSADGGSGSFAARYFKGPLNAIRLYSRVLGNKELAWNRAVDEARFFGVAIPESALLASAVPDAVVATAVAGAEGAETSGCYVVDEDGYTFRAALCATVGDTTYACTGYTLAKWNGSAWGESASHDGEFACFVAPGDKVRIEWQWKTASGSLVANPYVTDGLVLYYDGIWNAGVGAHDASATIWKDLSATGNDAELIKLADGGKWLANAYSFETNGHFQTTSAISLGATFTVQTVTDHTGYIHQASPSSWPWLFGSTDGKFQIYPNNDTPHIVLNADGLIGGGHRSELDWTDKHFLTAMFDVSSNVIAQTTSIAASWWKTGNTSTGPASQKFCIGGCASTLGDEAYRMARAARTPYHAIRVYSRLLDESERARNRTIDEARFFGSITPPATGAVVVQSSIAGLEGREPNGMYFPDGWTFSAGTATNTVRDIGWVCAGYQVQTWDAASSTWGAQQTVTVLRDGANAVEYKAAAASDASASVRLTWLWKPVSGIRSAADYAVADYAAGGIQLHLDGLEHGSSDTVWSDLSGNGRDATLAVNKNTPGDNGWTDDGYFFASNAVFATSASFSLGHDYTMQVLGDVNFADNHRASNANGGTFVSPIGHYSYGSIWLKSDDAGTIQHRTGDTTGVAWDMNAAVVVGTTGHASYLTALRNGKRTALVEGTAYPTSDNTKRSQACIDWSIGSKDEAASAMQWGVGAATAAAGGHPLYGTVKSVRLYDRMLSEEELAWNRAVDEARYFGELAVTNVVVAAAGAGAEQAESGAYRVFGSHTFTATTAVDADGNPKEATRYVLDEFVNGEWVTKGSYDNNEFTYTEGDYDHPVRITWKPNPPGMLIIIR